MHTQFLYRSGKGFIEGGVAVYIQLLVCQLMEDIGRGRKFALVEHAAHQRGESGVGGHAGYIYILSCSRELCGKGPGLVLIKIPAVLHAVDCQKAPFLQRDRKLGCGKYLPCDILSVQLDITAVTLILRKPEIGACKGAQFLCQH